SSHRRSHDAISIRRESRYEGSSSAENSTLDSNSDRKVRVPDQLRVTPSPAPVAPALCCVRFFAAEVAVARADGLGSRWEDVRTPLVAIDAPPDDTASEARVRALLERLGAVDLECTDDIALPPDCRADYVVRVDGDEHAFCAFTARALPE